jgi:hypothetical protein
MAPNLDREADPTWLYQVFRVPSKHSEAYVSLANAFLSNPTLLL